MGSISKVIACANKCARMLFYFYVKRSYSVSNAWILFSFKSGRSLNSKGIGFDDNLHFDACFNSVAYLKMKKKKGQCGEKVPTSKYFDSLATGLKDAVSDDEVYVSHSFGSEKIFIILDIK